MKSLISKIADYCCNKISNQEAKILLPEALFDWTNTKKHNETNRSEIQHGQLSEKTFRKIHNDLSKDLQNLADKLNSTMQEGSGKISFKNLGKQASSSIEDVRLALYILQNGESYFSDHIKIKGNYLYFFPDETSLEPLNNSPDITVVKTENGYGLAVSSEDIQNNKSYPQRQTIYKIGESLIKQQKEFLDKGLSYLKPMSLKDVALDIKMHESTVSRVISNRLIDTPQGIYKLKFFFHSGIKVNPGNKMSSVRIKSIIKKIVSQENPSNPFTDEQLEGMFKKVNINIARRTITKYRKELNVPSSNKRKSFS
jgi:DNA-directed RNA polymerase specialized sigma54-like protein